MRVYLLGHGIAYSASPSMHSAAFHAAGLDGWSYELLDVGVDDLPRAVESLRREGVAGANVTIPHKRAVLELLDEIDDVAAATGAVNTIVRDPRGRLLGSNTDVDGIRAAAEEVGFSGGDVVVLGAGGSARAVAVALPAASLTYVARDPARTGGFGAVVAWSDPAVGDLTRGAALLVNATPLGRAGELALPLTSLPLAGAVVDLVYAQGGTPLVRAARERGLRAADGWTVLVEQGAAAFQRWTGHSAPRAAMRAAVVA